jgi:hypothetical protein
MDLSSYRELGYVVAMERISSLFMPVPTCVPNLGIWIPYIPLSSYVAHLLSYLQVP